ncbi:MAG TPA: hypothetical protein VJT72_21655 [Pseudonocardiaceae bacterium]|nr:hypothetical protein [Pseudonocardiaceae bacterium]
MIRQLLNAFSTEILILLLVGGTVVLAIGGVLIARKMVPNLAESHFEDVVDGLRTVYELLFTIVLAFAIGAVIGTFGTAESKVSAEATKLAQMASASRDRDVTPDQRIVFNNAIGEYVHAVADDEFITMKAGETSPLAAIALDNLYGVYQRYTPEPGAELGYEMSLAALDEVAAMRRDRILQSTAELPSLLRIILVIGLVILLILEYRPKFPTVSTQLIHIALVAVIASSSVLLTILLDYPFAGEVAVSNTPFKQGALAQFWPSP